MVSVAEKKLKNMADIPTVGIQRQRSVGEWLAMKLKCRMQKDWIQA